MKLNVQNVAWQGCVGAVAVCLKRLIYEGYSSLRNQQMGLPTNRILQKRQIVNGAV